MSSPDYAAQNLADFAEHSWMLKKFDHNMQQVKQLFKNSVIVVGTAYVEMLPNQEPFVGAGVRLNEGCGRAH